MSEPSSIANQMFAALCRRNLLSEEDRQALIELPVGLRSLPPSSYLVREGQPPERCAYLIDGFTYRQKLTLDGYRTICALQVPGDFIDLQNIHLLESDHDVLALTDVVVGEVAIKHLQELAVERPAIGKAMWIDGLIEGSISREWLLNIGRRDARARMAHLLCEFSARLRATYLYTTRSFGLPMTQEQLGDALGLTSVHVNRILKALEKDGLIQRHKRLVTILDWPSLSEAADFNERYLHS